MKPIAPILFAGVASLALLSGCNDTSKADSNGEGDPAMEGALGDQVMVDPELAGQNGGAVSGGAASIELPPEQRSPEAIAAARQDAAQNAGGTLQTAPSPDGGSVAPLLESAATAAQVAAQSRAASTDCSSKVEYAMSWATKLPTPLKIYPRGAVQEAAGTEKDGCALRVVNFVSPVDAKDIVDYYYTMAQKGGYSATYKMDGSDHVLGGKKGAQAYVVYARKLDNGLTEVDLISSGT